MVTRAYSTSFSLGIYCLDRKMHDPIYGIYGFVRFADEIVDTFHDYDKKDLLDRFRTDTWKAIEDGVSLNPILHSFQKVVRDYNIEPELIETFLNSMEMDLQKKVYEDGEIENYILGSAEVVGLMCLRVFTDANDEEYERLKAPAMSLGSAFQKINFLRDLEADYRQLGRSYFPGVDLSEFNDEVKKQLEEDIEVDFKHGFEGIKQLPKGSRFGVYIAYVYYYALLSKIKNTPAQVLLHERVRIPNQKKYSLLLSSYVRHSLNLL
jgi:phytoene/squalene synthetase